jgi:hypothetical protein
MPFPTFKNFQSLFGRRLGLFQGIMSPFDEWLGGDQFQGVLNGTAAGLTTTAGQSSQALAFKLTAAVNQFTTVAASSFAVLPPAVIGMEVDVINDGAAVLQVCGAAATNDTIDGVATATGVPVTNARRTTFCALNTALPAQGSQSAVVGLWVSMGAAKST